VATIDRSQGLIRLNKNGVVYHPYVNDDGFYVLSTSSSNLKAAHKEPRVRQGEPLLPHLLDGCHLRMSPAEDGANYVLITPASIYAQLDKLPAAMWTNRPSV
jgi:hypothetical protein